MRALLFDKGIDPSNKRLKPHLPIEVFDEKFLSFYFLVTFGFKLRLKI